MEPLTQIAAGFTAEVFRTSDGRCLRVPRDAVGASRLRREASLLQVLVQLIEVELPWPSESLSATPRWPLGAYVYPWLVGTHPNAATDPATVAEFLGELHRINPDMLDARVLSRQHWSAEQISTAAAGIQAVTGRVEPGLLDWLSHVVDSHREQLLDLQCPAVVHGDFWSENMLIREGRLTGVLDWEAAGVGDPAIDLAGLWYLGNDWAEQVVGILEPGKDVLRRVDGWRVVRELHGAAWSVRCNDGHGLAESVSKVVSIADVLRG